MLSLEHLCRLFNSWIKMKLFLAESDIYLLQINSLETTVTGVYITTASMNLYSSFLERLAFLQKPGSPCMKKHDFTTGF